MRRRGVVALAGLAAVLATTSLVSTRLPAQQAGVDVLRYRFALDLPARGADLDVTATVVFQRARSVSALQLDLLLA